MVHVELPITGAWTLARGHCLLWVAALSQSEGYSDSLSGSLAKGTEFLKKEKKKD